MLPNALIKRINELERKRHAEGLTREEREEQRRLYDIYMSTVRVYTLDLPYKIECFDEETAKKMPPQMIQHATIVLGEKVKH